VPDRIYTLIYQCNNSNALAGTAQLTAALNQLDAQALRTQAHVKGVGTGSSTPLNAGSKAADKYAAALAALQASAQGAASSLNSIHAPALSIGGAMEQSSLGLIRFTGAISGLAIAHKVFSAVMDVTKEMEARWEKLAEKAAAFRDALRELAAIKGEEGPDKKVMKDVLKFAQETGLVPKEAGEAMAAYENIGPAVRQQQHYRPGGLKGTEAQQLGTEEQQKKLEKDVLTEAIKTGQRVGLAPKEAGEAIGQVAMFHKVESTEGAMTQFGMAMVGLSEGKMQYTAGIRALNKVSAKLVDVKDAADEERKPGRIGSFGEAGIYLGAMSLGTGNVDQAHNRMVQISKVVNPVDPRKQKELAEMGITDAMNDPARLIQMRKFFKDKGVDPLTYLGERKMGAPAELMSTAAGIKYADVLEKRLIKGRKDAEGYGTGKKVMASNAKYRKTQQSAINAQQEANREILEVQIGTEGAEQYEKAKKYAEDRLMARDPEYSGVIRNLVVGLSSIVSYPERGVGGFTAMQQEGVERTLRGAGKKVGIDIDKSYPDIKSKSYAKRSRAFLQASEAITAKGGDPYGQAATEAAIGERLETGQPAKRGINKENIFGPQASIGGGAGGDAVQVAQLEEMKKINEKLGAPTGAGVSVAMGPAPVAGGNLRVGES
jgi:hypothetical protein